jgi:hypothetical protein
MNTTTDTNFKVGDAVLFNGGNKGTVTEVLPNGMVVVRGTSGSVCLDAGDPLSVRPATEVGRG